MGELLADGSAEIELYTEGLRTVDSSALGALADIALASLSRPSGAAPGSGFTCAAQWSKCPARLEGTIA